MADVRGPGGMTNRDLLVTAYPNSATKSGGHFLDVEIDARDSGGEKFPHLSRMDTEYNGRKVVDTKAFYSAKQFEAIKAAAGDNAVQVPDRDGNPGPMVYALNADLSKMSAPKDAGDKPVRTGLVINTAKEMRPSSQLKIDEKVKENQFNTCQAKRQELKDAPQASEQAVQVEQPAVEAEPSL